MSNYLMGLDTHIHTHTHTHTQGGRGENNPVCNITYCSEMMLFKGYQMANTVC